jgi:DNA-binding transcriptional LysR family regulator
VDFRQARYLLAVAEHGNMLRAAKAIHVSQPALSKSIKNLESELGVRLFDRGPRGVTPTIYGAALLKHARLQLNQGEQAVAEIGAIKDGRLGHLCLGVANFAIHFLPSVLAELLSSKPGVSFEIVDGAYEDLTELLREGALDAVISGLPPVHQAEDLVHEELVATRFVRVCRPDYRPYQRRHVSLAELAGARWILPNRPQAILDLWELDFREAHINPPKPLLLSTSMMFIKSMLLEGHFITVLPRGIVEPEVRRGLLTAVPGDPPVSEGIIYRPGDAHPPALIALIEAIRARTPARWRSGRRVAQNRQQ